MKINSVEIKGGHIFFYVDSVDVRRGRIVNVALDDNPQMTLNGFNTELNKRTTKQAPISGSYVICELGDNYIEAIRGNASAMPKTAMTGTAE